MCDRLTILICGVLVFALAGVASAALPPGWASQDIGDEGLPGSADELAGIWTVVGSGHDIWDAADDFHFANLPLRGNGTITAQVVSIVDGTNAWRKAGVMIRETLADDSNHSFMAMTNPGATAHASSYQWRSVLDGNNNNTDLVPSGYTAMPWWVKLVRDGDIMTASVSPDGIAWTEVDSVVNEMAADVYIGLAVTSHNNDETTTATFDNVTVLRPQMGIAIDPDPADQSYVIPGIYASNVYMMLDYTPGTGAITHTAYFSDVEQDVIDRDPDHSLGSVPPWPQADAEAFVVGYDDPGIPEYARAPLVRAMTYYWCIDEDDGTTVWPGEIWSFTVTPRKAWAPSPADGATFVFSDPNLTVSWTMGDIDTDGNTVSYDVYYDTDAAAVGAATVPNKTVAATSCEIGPLAYETGHAWRVDTVLTRTAPPFTVTRVEGDVWQFETMPEITVTDPNLQGWWKFDVGYGTTAIDWSGHDRHGTLIGPSPTWAPGVLGNALQFDGSDNSYVNIDGYKGVLGTSAFSVTAWVKSTATGDRTIMSWGTGTSTERVDFRLFEGRLRVEHGAGNRQGDTVLADDEWHHVALTIAENATISYPEVKLWLDGRDDTRSGTDPDAFNLVAQNDVGIGIRVHNDQREFVGTLDDVRLYDKELTAGQISQILDPARAWDPTPADGDKDVALGTTLTWKAGADPDTGRDFTTHHLYFSTSFEDVNSESISPIVLTGATEHVPALEYYGRYFWKVNEVGSSVVTGNIWTFKVTHDPAQVVDPNLKAWYRMDGDGSDSSGYGNHAEPFIPASYVPSDDGQALQLYGNNYLEAIDYTGVTGTHSRTLAAWIKTTTFGEIMSWGQDTTSLKWIFRVQESNGTLGAIRIEISGGYVVGSIDVRDNEWHHVAAVLEDDGSPMAGEIVLYVDGSANVQSALNDNSINTADATNVRIGKAPWNTRWFTGLIDDARIYDRALSETEIQTLYRVNLAWAWNPSPMHGAVDVDRDLVLSWSPGDGATAHTVWFGADDPANMVEVAGPQTGTTYDPLGSLDLELGTTYYWSVIESPGGVMGRTWKFTTTDNILVDDMESYVIWSNPAGPHIFVAWRDGFGDCSTGNGNDTGSVLTENPAPVLGGIQSMKYDFDNDGTVYSPCTMGLVTGRHMYSKIEAQIATLPSGIGADWTIPGIRALSLRFYGSPLNDLEPMWVQLQDATKGYGEKVTYGDYEGEDTNDITDESWHDWFIDLADFDVDLANLVSISIGFGNENGSGEHGSGTVYFDDFRLYTPQCIAARRSAEFANVDLDADCRVDYRDLEILVGDWLETDFLEIGELLVRWEFNDAAGTVATDTSGNSTGHARNGDVNDTNGDSWFFDGTRGWCLDFNDGDFVLDNDANAYMNGLRGLTVAVWVKNRETAPTDQGFIIFADPAGNDNRGFRYDSAGAGTGGTNLMKCGTFSTGPSGGIQEYESASNTQTTAWQHLAMTWSSGNDVRLFINGVEDTTGAIQATRTGTTSGYTKLFVGRGGKFNDAGVGGWNGLIDDVQIYNHALTTPEIATVMAGGTIPTRSIHYPLTSPAEIYELEAPGSRVINFLDYAGLMNAWLAEEIFPY